MPTVELDAEVLSPLYVAELLSLQEQGRQSGDEYTVAPGVVVRRLSQHEERGANALVILKAILEYGADIATIATAAAWIVAKLGGGRCQRVTIDRRVVELEEGEVARSRHPYGEFRYRTSDVKSVSQPGVETSRRFCSSCRVLVQVCMAVTMSIWSA